MITENIFGGKRLFTTTEPTNYKIRKTKAHELASSTKRFLDECFRGAIELSIAENTFGYVEISVYGFAYLVKLVLSKVYGERVLHASISFTRQSVVFNVEYGKDADDGELADAISIAQRSGLSIEQDGSKLIFCAPVKQSDLITLYARDGIYSLSVYNEVFFI